MHRDVHIAAGLACLLLAACSGQSTQSGTAAQPPLERAGQPVDPLKTAGRITAIRAAALTGNQAEVERQFGAMHNDMMQSMKLPDPARRIDPEAARAAVRAVPGVRSVAWLDHENLMVRVDGMHHRSQQAIDAVCRQLQPLGDTLSVVVHLQNAAPGSRDETDTLSRNCQLASGDRAFMQRDRRVDALDPAVRAQYRAETDRFRAREPRGQSEGDRAALEAIPEM